MRPEFHHLVDRIDRLIQNRVEDLAKGAAKDFAEYKHAVGVISGLKMAAQEIEDVGKADEED
jgi:hypothetical protein